jgi:23S rRNA pseudouridine1911/1915/1917 synthase
MILTYTAGQGDAGRKVYHILRKDLDLSAAMVRRLKQTDAICLDGQSVFTDRTVQPGQRLTVAVTLAEPPCDVVPQEGPVEILYEDGGLLALNKPAGMIVHPSHSRYTDTLANYAAGYLLRTTGSGACHAVGRLDRDTGGVVLFAKNSYMKYRAAKAMAAGEKRYLALAAGGPEADRGVMDFPIRREREGDMRRIVAPDGQRAVTRYAVLARHRLSGQAVTLLELTLETGRTHQIRVHCAHMGMPLLGDTLYQTEQSRALSETLGVHGQALHAGYLAITEPLSGTALTITAPIRRADFRAVLASMGVAT